jgi:hypothetical protein
MHLDSDDEGRGGVRNPVMSTIVYVTAGSGRPSLLARLLRTVIRLERLAMSPQRETLSCL